MTYQKFVLALGLTGLMLLSFQNFGPSPDYEEVNGIIHNVAPDTEIASGTVVFVESGEECKGKEFEGYKLPAHKGDADVIKSYYKNGWTLDWECTKGEGDSNRVAKLVSVPSGHAPISIGAELCKLTEVTELELRGSRDAAMLSGVIPSCLSELTKLSYLDLSHNKLVSPIPVELSKISSLRVLHLGFNSFSGDIPDGLLSLNLRELDLSSNAFTSVPPAKLSAMKELRFLNLRNNKLSGVVPDVSSLKSLEQVYMDFNQLTGDLPMSRAPASTAGF